MDKGLQPGKQYSYSLFTRLRGRWIGPLVVVAGTAPPSGSTDASYIAAPTTLLAKASDIASVTTTGTGVRLVLKGQVPTPPLGAGVTLPISGELPGGFLGVVATISTDGRTLDLAAGDLADASDYYELSVEEFSAGLEPPAAEAPAAELCKAVPEGPQINFSAPPPWAATSRPRSTSTASSAPTFPSGHPWTWGLTAKVVGEAEIKTTAGSTRSSPLGKLAKTLTASPVPISPTLEPVARFSIGGSLQLDTSG